MHNSPWWLKSLWHSIACNFLRASGQVCPSPNVDDQTVRMTAFSQPTPTVILHFWRLSPLRQADEQCRGVTDTFNIIIIVSLVTGLFFPVILLNQQWSPTLRLQASHCSTFRIMCDIPSIAVIIIIIIIITIFNLRTAAFKAYCVIWVRRSNFCHQASPREHPAAEGGNVGEKCLGILPKSRLPRYI